MSYSYETEEGLKSTVTHKSLGNVLTKKNQLQLLLVGSELLVFYLVHQILVFPSVHIARQALMYVMLCSIFGHFNCTTNLIWQEVQVVVKCNMAFFFSLIVMSPLKTFTFIDFIKYFVLCLVMLSTSLVLSRFYRGFFSKYFSSKVLVIGTGENAKAVIDTCKSSRFTLADIKAQIDCVDSCFFPSIKQEKLMTSDIPVYDFCQLNEVLNKHRIDEVLVALPQASKDEMSLIMNSLHNKVKVIKFLPRVNGMMTFDSKIEDFNGVLVVSSSLDKMNYFDKMFKRFFDVLAGFVGVLINIPLYLTVRYLNRKNGDNEPILFKQTRIGEYGEPITIYKYRSMIPNAEAVLEKMMAEDPKIKEEYLTNKKLENDPRITEVGKFLRKTSLDEFPQFLNVLKGEMSLIGPRPYLPREMNDMGFYYDSIIQCKPGITGMWQANGRSEVSFEQRCKLDDYYFKNWSIWLDMTILFKTLKSVIYERGAR